MTFVRMLSVFKITIKPLTSKNAHGVENVT